MKVLMFAHAGSLNRGCEAIVRSTVNMIKKMNPQAKVYLASGNPSSDAMIENLDDVFDARPIPITRYSYDWIVSSMQLKLFKTESYALRRIEQGTIRHISDMDVCLSIGGDNYCYGDQPGLYEINRTVKEAGKKLVLWGCSIGEEDMNERKLVDLQQFDLILARESLTHEMLCQAGLHNVERCADPAFTLEYEELELPSGWKEGKMIGLNYSPLVYQRNPASKNAVRHLIAHILAHTDLCIALTPHVIEPGNDDAEILKSYYEEFKHTGRVILLPDDLNAMQYKGYIRRMRFFIGARTHATIAAYSSMVPTMVLGYSVKSKGIAKDLFGLEKLVLSLEQLSVSSILIERFNELIRDEAAIKLQLELVLPDMHRLSLRAGTRLQELVQGVHL